MKSFSPRAVLPGALCAVLTAIAVADAPPVIPTPASAPTSANAGIQGAEAGWAAVYNDRLNGRRTASGAKYDRNQLTAAHKTLPFGTRVKVTRQSNGRSVIVKITDRGPMQADRVIDLSPRAARALHLSGHSMAKVDLEVLR